MSLRFRLLVAIGSAFISLAPLTATALNLRSVVVRAVGKAPSKAVVNYVAQNAQPIPLAKPKASTIGAKQQDTVADEVTAICGSMQPGYAEQLATLNGTSLAILDAPTSNLPDGFLLPACLYATSSDQTIRYTIENNDTLTNIRQKFTGDGRFDQAGLNAYFSRSRIDINEPLVAGKEISLPFKTAPTTLQLDSASADEFAANLAKLGGDAVAITPGEIIQAVQFKGGNDDSAGSTQGGFAQCQPGDGTRAYPFDPEEIANAIVWTKAHLKTPLTPVSIVIVDNGFFGVPCETDGPCPPMQGDHVVDGAPRFPSNLFDFDEFQSQFGFGPVVVSNIWAINYLNTREDGERFQKGDVNRESGHGTHVAGLTIGGPLMLPYRDSVLNANGRPLTTLVIAAISKGQRTLALGSDSQLPFVLQHNIGGGTKVINLSIEFNAKADPKISGRISDMIIRDHDDSLFVAAAGNNGSTDIDQSDLDLHPLKEGGLKTTNLITVASVDGPQADTSQRLSSFTNSGGTYVDIAAPGCEIQSWLDTSSDPVAISGTSQAAPIVSFAASNLRSLWLNAKAADVRNRILASGDLLADPVDQMAIASRTQLNIAKALTFTVDRLVYDQDGVRHEVVGDIGVNSLVGLQCDGANELAAKEIRAIKRTSLGESFAIYRTDTNHVLYVCTGSQAGTIKFEMKVLAEQIGSKLQDAPQSIEIAANHVLEVVRAR